MIIKQTDDNGDEVEVEVLTQEEVDAKLEATKKEFEEKLAEKDNILSNLSKDKEELEKKINEAKPDHPNFASLKEALKAKDNEIKKIQEEVQNDRKLRIQEAFDAKIKIATKGNEEVEKKVKLHLNTTLSGMPESTEEERQIKLNAALKLSADYSTPSILDGVTHGTSGGSFNMNESTSTVEFTSREKALGAKLGITAEDYKKYGPRLNKK